MKVLHTPAVVALAAAIAGFALGSSPQNGGRGKPAFAQRGSALPERRDLVGKHFDAKVTRVADGDTLDAIPVGESRPVRIRLQGVDAPELGEVFSREAQAFLRTMTFDQRVRVEGRDMDRYGRLVARVWAGKDASVELIRAGLACHAFARDAALAREQQQARTAGRGFWSSTATKPACATETSFGSRGRVGPGSAGTQGASSTDKEGAGFSPAERQAGDAKNRTSGAVKPSASSSARVVAGYRGNVSSGLYHASTCPNANCRNCTRLFTTEAEAKAAGFTPAGDCLK